jgi:hypothetical protein
MVDQPLVASAQGVQRTKGRYFRTQNPSRTGCYRVLRLRIGRHLMRSPHFGVKTRPPTCCVKFSAYPQHLGAFYTPVENSIRAQADLPASARGCGERWGGVRISGASGYGHCTTSLFISIAVWLVRVLLKVCADFDRRGRWGVREETAPHRQRRSPRGARNRSLSACAWWSLAKPGEGPARDAQGPTREAGVLGGPMRHAPGPFAAKRSVG